MGAMHRTMLSQHPEWQCYDPSQNSDIRIYLCGNIEQITAGLPVIPGYIRVRYNGFRLDLVTFVPEG